MQTKYKIPADVRQTVLGYIRGHKRRLNWYLREREDITLSSLVPCPERDKDGSLVYMSGGGTPGDQTASKAARLEALEKHPNVQVMRAIERARLMIGEDIKGDIERQRLVNSIWESCIQGRRFVFEYTNLPMCKATFYNRRQRFLYDIAAALNLIS